MNTAIWYIIFGTYARICFSQISCHSTGVATHLYSIANSQPLLGVFITKFIFANFPIFLKFLLILGLKISEIVVFLLIQFVMFA